jgi:hypothetical protein
LAQVTSHRPLNMQTIFTWYGDVAEASAGRIVISDGARMGIYEGNFTYNVYGDVSGGTLAAFTHSTLGNLDYTVTGLSVNAVVAADLIDRSDIQTLFRIALSGGDGIYGSSGADVDFPPRRGGVGSERHAAAGMVIPSMLVRASAGVR